MAASTMLSTRGILDKKAGSKNGKSARKRPAQPPIKCPECSSTKTWKDGLRYTNLGTVQRYICRNCAYRFSDPDFQHAFNGSDMSEHVQNVLTKKLKRHADILNLRQVCVALTEGTKNLAKVETRKEKPMREGTKQTAEIKGKILEYAWKLKKRGLSESTIKTRIYQLSQLVKKGADLDNSDSVETVLATEKLTACQKKGRVAAYSSYAKTMGFQWTPIKTKYQPKQPFIPLESELNQLIAASGKITACFLQTLKDTGARSGEAVKLKWTDVNFENNTISINDPEKGSNTRTIKVSPKTIAMINALPKKYGEYLFNTRPPPAASIKESFQLVRKRLARNLQNPRFLQIHFHTFRHWKATMEYTKTKDILHVRQLLGHKQIQSTLIYTTLVNFEANEYIVKRPSTAKEEDELIKTCFEYVRFDDKEQVPIYRKRK